MRKFSILLLLLFVSSCAGTAQYVTLNYHPAGGRAEDKKVVVTTARFKDLRDVKDTKLLGYRDAEAPIMSMSLEPSAVLAEAMRRHLEHMGYEVNEVPVAWDGSESTLDSSWKGIVVGGTINDFGISARTGITGTEYLASANLSVVLGDPAKGRIIHKETIEVKTTYKTVMFTRAKAEELMNKVLADAVYKSLSGIDASAGR